MMNIIDITNVLDENTPVYPGDPGFEKQIINKNGFAICKLSMSSHAGTHMDAPSHLAGGNTTIAGIPLEKLIGPCAVCDTLIDIRQAVLGDIRKILYRGEPDDLSKIARLDIELLGIENLSVGDREMHKLFLHKNIVVVEGLALGHVKKGSYWLAALPLKVNIDGSPVRAVLLETEGGLV